MIALWFKDRLNALWLVEEAGCGEVRRWDRYFRVSLPDAFDVRALIEEIGITPGGLYPQDDAIADYRRVNRWKEL